MRDWDEYVRRRLPLRDVEAQREGSIVEELATQLEDRATVFEDIGLWQWGTSAVTGGGEAMDRRDRGHVPCARGPTRRGPWIHAASFGSRTRSTSRSTRH